MMCHCTASEFSFSELPVFSTLFPLLATGCNCNWDAICSVVMDVLSNYNAVFAPLAKC